MWNVKGKVSVCVKTKEKSNSDLRISQNMKIYYVYPKISDAKISSHTYLKIWTRPFCPVRQHSFVKIDHEILSTVILSLRWFPTPIQEEQLPIVYLYWLTS